MRLLYETETSPWEMLDELVPRPVSWLWRQAVHTPVSNTCLPVSRLSPLSSPSNVTSVECYTSKIPWRAPLCLSKQIPSLTDPLRLQFSNRLWNTKSHLPNELWQWDLPCLPVVRALPGCLSQSLLDEPFLCTNWGEANMVLSVLKFSNMYLNMTFVIIFTQFSLGAI